MKSWSPRTTNPGFGAGIIPFGSGPPLNPVAAPQESIDLLVALDSATVDLHRPELSPRGIILIDEDLSTPEDCCRKVPFKELAPDRYANITALGVVSTLLGLKEEIVVRAADDFFGHKSPEAAEGNRQALQAAFTWTKKQSISFPSLPEAQRHHLKTDPYRE